MSSTQTPDDRADWLQHSRSAWNERAGDWDKMLQEGRHYRQEELERTIAALDLRPGLRLLDAGCGNGQWSIGFARAGCDVVAVDLAPAMLERGREHAREAGVEIEFREGDLGNLPDSDASFDVVHARCTLQLTPDPVGVLRGFARVLKPGGRLFAAVPGGLSHIYHDSYRRFLDPDFFNNRMLPWELERLLVDLGWTVRDGWGVFAPSDDPQAMTADQAAQLARPLQQAACTYWSLVAAPPSS